FANSGQVCMCTDRIIVHESLAEELIRRLAAVAEAMSVGDPTGESTDMGPVIDDSAAAQFDALVKDAVDNGARIAAGGTREGRFVRPTVLTDVGPTARFYTEEGFLPIVSVLPYQTDDEA